MKHIYFVFFQVSVFLSLLVLGGCDLFADKEPKPWERFVGREDVKFFYDYQNILYQIVTYKDGVRHGLSELYFPTGHIYGRKYFENDLIQGKVVYFYPTGEVNIEIDFVDDLPHGTYHAYYPNGATKRIKLFQNGLPVGTAISYYLRGEIQSVERFKDGQLHGLAEYFNPSGKHTKVNLYGKGVLFETQYPDKTGKVALAKNAPRDDIIKADSLDGPSTEGL